MFVYEYNLISRRYSDTKKALITTPSDFPILTAFFSNNIVHDLQENPDDEADDRTSEDYLRDSDIEFHERALLANLKRFTKRKNKFSIQKANDDTECYKYGKKRKDHARNGGWIDITMKKVNILLSMDKDSEWQNYLKYINIDLKEPIWYLDSGCLRSMTGAKSYRHKYVEKPGPKSLKLPQENHVPKVVALNEPDIPHTKNAEGPPDLINTKKSHEQNVQIKQTITQSNEGPSWNNTEVLASIIESLVLDVPQSQVSNQASTSSHLVPQNRWSNDQHIEHVNIIADHDKGMLTRSMTTKLTAASAIECLFANFLSKIEPKRNKKDEHGITTKNKARLVVQGYSQEEGIDYDETFIPVARMDSIRIFLAFATYVNFIVFQMDVKSAFLNDKLKKEVCVKPPLGFESSDFPDYVCKLDKALYGLKQAPKACSSMKTPMVPPNSLGLDLAGKPSNPKESHIIAAKRILRKSTSGAYQILGGKLVCWSTKKQQSVAMSSVEAEYVAAIRCCASILWMKSQLSDYDIHYNMAPIFCDNTNAIAISNNPVLYSRTKHIDISYPQTAPAYIDIFKFLMNRLLAKAFTKIPSVAYQNFLREFWCTTTSYDPNPPINDFEARPFKEYLIKFSMMNCKKPLILEYKIFVESTGLDYAKDTYVSHPSPEAVKAKLAKIIKNLILLDRTPVMTNSFLVVQIVLWYLDSDCSKHMTGDRSQLTNFVDKFMGSIKFGNDHMAKIIGYGDYQIGNNLYNLSLRDMITSSPMCLLSKASKTKSWLWHQRLSHLNFGAINHLARQGLVRGLPKLKFKKDHLCSACVMGKSKKKSYKPKSEDTNQEKLYLLHMDLCRPMRVKSVYGKKYILVIVDDYSRFTWVKFLRSKDEAPNFIIKFLKMIQVGISYETSVARSTHQNGVVKRRNRTLIEAVRTISGPTLHEITPATISLRLVPNPTSSTSFVPPSRTDWDMLFQPLFDELLTPLPSVDHAAPEVIAPIAKVVALEPAASTGSPSSITVDQDVPSAGNPQITPKPQSSIIPNDVEDDNHELDVTHTNNDPFFGLPILEVSSGQSSSTDIIHTIVQPDHQILEPNSKWTKDHPLENIIGELARPVSTRLQLHEKALFIYYNAILTSVEPKTYKDALN
uniref:Retrovirus-related Pol polyprotein from transposon TNT 1-94 n=1 Tax=Tanacetum cinerariifolium TaxID=118510 RepID=A0A6L2JRF4_TANCI|nr:retrovirus-related Pol polyprotein from transposon TNT 1-94 [Tanacetum cinerariifolium]